ncbi:ATP-dependent DNA helicase UvrD2 [Luedemannella flava]|uniref:ATP-dependent DNA helicase UvrD2 n=1 Tax=Luedemannella flava TaxID=349316 RepID=UPI0031E33526
MTGDAVRAVLDGLDEEQRAAVTAPAGPVCILAGAGTGKTRAITHRVAYRALTGEIQPRHVLAVTFTARAAAQMRERLARLGVPGVQARTFHAAALRQLRYFAPRLFAGRELPELVESKARLIGLAAGRAGIRADRTLARDLASEIEWAKSSLVEPGDYEVAAAKAGREPPVSTAQVAAVFTAYERVKRSSGVIDFEDLLRAGAWAIEEHPDVAEQIHAQYRHFVVDEYQDVNPVQQRLLDAWLCGRDDLTVVGDASQTIYSFTGATSAYLVNFARRGGGTVVRLVKDYRSTPQVVGLANQVIRQASGEEARLRLELVGQRPDGPQPQILGYPDEPAEAAGVARRCAELVAAGTPAREIAVLFRVNAQSEAYEAALAEAGVPYVVQGAERFFERVEIRQAMAALRAATRTYVEGTPLREAVVEALSALGWQPDTPPPGGAVRERWEALSALVTLSEEYAVGGLAEFNAELSRRAAMQHAPTVEGVTLASLHAAKGLEWDAVFVVGCSEGTLPTPYAKTPEALEEERRLLYVGITRARQFLTLSYAASRAPGGRQRRPSRFLPVERSAEPVVRERRRTARDADGTRRRMIAVPCRVCGATLTDAAARKLGRCADCPSSLDSDLFERLRTWRAGVAATSHVPPYVVFTDATITAIAERAPSSEAQLIDIAGIGPRKLGLYGTAVLALVGGANPTDLLPELQKDAAQEDDESVGEILS